MSISTNRLVVIITAVVWAMSIGRSILIMLGGKNVFRKAHKNERSALIPILNLFTMLEIAEVSTFFGILFFVPALNLIPMTLMSLNIGKSFNTGFAFTLGLIFLPIIFYPILFFSDKSYQSRKQEYFKALDGAVQAEDLNLMTPDIIEDTNSINNVEESQNIDSIFKSDIELMEEATPYKASKIDNYTLNKMDELKLDDYDFEPIKRNDNNQSNQNSNKSENKVEFIDL